MRHLLLLLSVIIHIPIFSQHYSRVDSIYVKANGNWLKMPWAGGLNHCQFSDIDLDMDGIKDLVAFDRTGNKINTFINKGTPGQVDYASKPEYAKFFPHVESWMLLIDYNCDGKEDLFTFNYGTPSGVTVYKNTSTSTTLQFTLVKQYLTIGTQAMYMSSIGLPAIEDVDNDGDLDILMFETGGWTLNHYINKSKELGYSCDSLIFTKSPSCWGRFTEVASTCSAALNSCSINQTDTTSNIKTQNNASDERNGGSCLLCLDMDADGDKELYLGQLNCCTIALLTNGGSVSSANMTSVTPNFPASDPIKLSTFPCAYFLDLNNDSKRDLIVSSSNPGSSANTESVWYYENTGADNAPVFIKNTRKLFQEEMIDVGEGSSPALFDFDQDGLIDLLVSNYTALYDSCPSTFSYGVSAYKNIGTTTAPKFELISTDYANLSTQLPYAYGMHLTFGDIDNDGDPDMLVGDYLGLIHCLENTAGSGNAANFTVTAPINYKDAKGDSIDIGSHSTPQLIDLDRDGDLDLLIGEAAGNINYYENIGTVTAPSYSFMTTTLGGVDVMKPCCTGYSVPFVYDSLGSYRLLVGSEASQKNGLQTGWLWYYKNIDNNIGGQFTLIDSTYQHIWEGTRMCITGKDITNDGRMDLVIGNYAGGVAFYMGDTLKTSTKDIPALAFDFSVFPSPASDHFIIRISDQNKTSKNYRLRLYNLIGEAIYQKEIEQKENIISISNLSNGVYFCEINTDKFKLAKKLVILK